MYSNSCFNSVWCVAKSDRCSPHKKVSEQISELVCAELTLYMIAVG